MKGGLYLYIVYCDTSEKHGISHSTLGLDSSNATPVDGHQAGPFSHNKKTT